MRGLITVFLLLASWSATAGCVEGLLQKTTVKGDVTTLKVNGVLQIVCTITDNNGSLLDWVEIDPAYNNAEMETALVVYKGLKLGKPALSNTDAMQFVVAHELAHMKLNHYGERLGRNFFVFFFGIALLVATCLLIYYKKYRLVIPVVAALLTAHLLSSWYEYSNYLEDEHEADIEGLRLLSQHGFSAESAANAFFSSHVESAPSFLDNYVRCPLEVSLRSKNPHPSTYARKARIAEHAEVWALY